MYYRLVRLSGKWIGIKLDVDMIEDDMENIEIFITEGNVVAMGGDLEQLADALEIEVDEIDIVE